MLILWNLIDNFRVYWSGAIPSGITDVVVQPVSLNEML